MPWQLENKLVASGIGFPSARLVTEVGNFPSGLCGGFLHFGLGGSGGLQRGEEEWGAAWVDLSILASGPLPSFPTQSTGPFPMVLASLFPRLELNLFFFLKIPYWASTYLHLD